MNAALFTDFYT